MELIQEIALHAQEWSKEAGRIQLEAFRTRNLGIETKTNIHDVVTRIDKECEAFLIEKIQKTYPGHAILGEESGAHESNSDWKWIIDPLDGTNNYSQGLPVFCVSIGVTYRDITQVGVVYAPYLNELYVAVKGKGATLNTLPIHISEKENLNECVLGTGFPYDKDINPDNNLDNVRELLPQIRGLRRMGAAAYDLCCVAGGFLDGYWEFNLQPWDVCAGMLIVEEAGGEIYHFRSDRNVAIIAANKQILAKILSNLYVPRS